MRLTGTDEDSAHNLELELDSPAAGPSTSTSLAGPSSNGRNGASKSNGYANGSSKVDVYKNGAAGAGANAAGNSVARVSLPGSTLYDDSYVDREEFVRLVIQSLRDVGYIESAATLEAESGYVMETPEVAEFRKCILDAEWASADMALMRLGVADDERLWEAKFLISQQKYLELLEARKTTAALQVLRNELAPLNPDPEQLHSLSSLMMCSDPDDLRTRAAWDGASGRSRRQLLVNLQRYISSSLMIPQRRIATLLEQARLYQQSRCLYHNAPADGRGSSLYSDHQCDEATFPRVTTAILDVHKDEVWNLEWSHSGAFLASASKDRSAIIWRVEFDRDPAIREYSPVHVLADHPYAVGCVAWSLDDAVLLTAAEHVIKLWNTRTGVCVRTLEAAHTDVVTALEWLPDNSGFISGGLDRKIIIWDADGKQRDSWGQTPIRVTDLAVTPDFTRLIAVGMCDPPSLMGAAAAPDGGIPAVTAGPGIAAGRSTTEARVMIYDLASKQPETSKVLPGELTSVKTSQDSQYVLISRAGNGLPGEIQLWDLSTERELRKYIGHSQGKHVIRSCFGGAAGAFVASGSEDGHVYVWHRDTATLLHALPGHGTGSVNAVAWNPRNERMFASCSDDRTLRIWEAPPPDVLGAPSSGVEAADEGKDKGKGRDVDGFRNIEASGSASASTSGAGMAMEEGLAAVMAMASSRTREPHL